MNTTKKENVAKNIGDIYSAMKNIFKNGNNPHYYITLGDVTYLVRPNRLIHLGKRAHVKGGKL
jgi:hypothetical protein